MAADWGPKGINANPFFSRLMRGVGLLRQNHLNSTSIDSSFHNITVDWGYDKILIIRLAWNNTGNYRMKKESKHSTSMVLRPLRPEHSMFSWQGW